MLPPKLPTLRYFSQVFEFGLKFPNGFSENLFSSALQVLALKNQDSAEANAEACLTNGFGKYHFRNNFLYTKPRGVCFCAGGVRILAIRCTAAGFLSLFDLQQKVKTSKNLQNQM